MTLRAPDRLRSFLVLLHALVPCLFLAPAAAAEERSPLARVESLPLRTLEVGGVVAYSLPEDRERARQLATLAASAAKYFERELDLALPVRIAALRPADWFSDIPGLPYAIPWPSMSEGLIVMPSSLEEGLLVEGRDAREDRRRIDFVLLHEDGHLLARRYFRPADGHDYLPVKWFEELLATYFAYSFVAAAEPSWAEAARTEWRSQLRAFDPPVHSLDWSYMNALPGPEIARNYAWYQFLLNLRAAELHERYGIALLRRLKAGLQWERSADWTTATLLPRLDAIAPGFAAWADEVAAGGGAGQP